MSTVETYLVDENTLVIFNIIAYGENELRFLHKSVSWKLKFDKEKGRASLALNQRLSKKLTKPVVKFYRDSDDQWRSNTVFITNGDLHKSTLPPRPSSELMECVAKSLHQMII